MKYSSKYIKAIQDSVNSKDYKNFFICRTNEKVDVLKNGQLSCAFFVSSILKRFNLIDHAYCTVQTTIKKLKAQWREIDLKDIQVGDIILWDKKKQGDTGSHFHLGFYVGNGKAISNSWYKKSPRKHAYNYNGRRKILKIFSLF